MKIFRTILLVFVFLFLSLAAVHVKQVEVFAEISTQEQEKTSQSTLFLPLISEGSPPALCRFGVNVVSPIEQFDISPLRMGWYANYNAVEDPARPNGVKFAQTIRLSQVGANDYEMTVSESDILSIIAQNPGGDWLIGNEPDRRDFQDDLEPHVYARAYHDLYTLIKTEDPTARIFAGTIVQPTPVRLQYLDMVLDSYESTYGQKMPVDAWSIHNFILNEVSCDYDESNCWGAEIPPGIDAPFGEVLNIDDNDNIDLFIERIERFRQWMFDRGYGGLPVSLSEYGVLMPDWLGFDAARINVFMDETFDYMLTATDPLLGDPNDEYRLIQKFSWYSTGAPADPYNGYLFDPNTKKMSAMGINYANYAAKIATDVDLYAVQLQVQQDDNNDVTLLATVANGGNLAQASGPVTVRFYRGNPVNGVLIGTALSRPLAGCGDNDIAEVGWEDAPVGSHQIYVVVDPHNVVQETDESNNVLQQAVTIGAP